ncbi:MAG: universal stress protein [Bacteroidia bacterium]
MHALSYALPLAQRLKARLTMLHVNVPEPVVAGATPVQTAEKWAHAQPLVEQYSDVEIGYDEETGENPADIIVELSKQNNYDLIVMGTKGSGGLVSGSFGGITVAVIQGCETPVLAIPDCATYQPIRHIAYATDFNNESFSVVKRLIAFAKLLDARLTCIHVRGENDYWDRVKRMYYEQLYSLGQVTDVLDFAILRGDNVLRAIQDFVRNNDVDVLSMLNRRRDLLDTLYGKSLTREAVLHCRVPLLAFHNH